MAIYALGGLVPHIDDAAWIHPDAVIIGNVTIGAHTSVWPAAVLRGDSDAIVVGERTSVQDGVVIHTSAGLPTRVGSGVTLGHQCHLEGATVEDDALIGVGSILLHRVHVGAGALVAAGAVLTPDTVVPARAMAKGVPATIRPDAVAEGAFRANAQTYVEAIARYRASLRRLDGPDGQA